MLKALREQRAKLGAEIKRMAELANDEKHTWTAEDEENWQKLNGDYDTLGERIGRIERAEAVEAELRSPGPNGDVGRENRRWSPKEAEETEEETEERQAEETIVEADPDPEFRGPKNPIRGNTEEERALVIQAWFRAQSDLELTKRQRDVCRRYGFNPLRKYLDISMSRDFAQVRAEYRAQSTSATAGGETIPAGFMPRFERALLNFDGVRQVAEVLRTATGNAITWPMFNDTGNVGALLAENTNTTEQAITTAAFTLNAYKYTSKLVLVSAELLEDSAFNLATMLGDILGERIGRALNAAFSTADGSSKPKGIVPAATVGKTTAGATAITADELIDLLGSVDPAYLPGAAWMMHQNIMIYVRKLKEQGTPGQYIWQQGLQMGVPDRLLGFPVILNNAMQSSVATATRTAIFGQLSAYKIRDVGSVRLRRLVERYGEYDQDGFVAFSRHDGDLLDAGTHPVMALLQA